MVNSSGTWSSPVKLQRKLTARLSTDRDTWTHCLVCSGELRVQPSIGHNFISQHCGGPSCSSGAALRPGSRMANGNKLGRDRWWGSHHRAVMSAFINEIVKKYFGLKTGLGSLMTTALDLSGVIHQRVRNSTELNFRVTICSIPKHEVNDTTSGNKNGNYRLKEDGGQKEKNN